MVNLHGKSATRLVLIAGTLAFGAGATPGLTSAQTPSGATLSVDPYQRSYDHFVFKSTAKSGPQRGEELYYYKCSFCHIQYAKRAPNLKDLFKRPSVTDQMVAEKIRKGGPGMPSYGTMLNDADISDLVSYLKEKCCWEGEDNPPNPRYRAGTGR
jgi:mono/diheme cytochrome c family protein